MIAAFVVVAAGSAAAEGAPGPGDEGKTSLVVLRTPLCALPSANVDRFVQLLAIDLAVARIQLVRDVPVPDAEMIIEMDGATCALLSREVGVSLVRPSGSRAAYTIALHDVEEGARPRALALAVAELVRTAQTQADGTPSDPPRAADVTRGTQSPATANEPAEKTARERPGTGIPPAPPAEPTASNDRPKLPWLGQAEASFGLRLYAPETTTLSGVTLTAALRLRPAWLSIRAGAAASWTSLDDPLGRIALSVYSGGFSLRATTGRFPELSIGPHLELGLARGAGSVSVSGGSTAFVDTKLIALASLTTGARFWIDRWAPFIELDLGAAIAGADVYADDRRVAAVSGAFVGLRAGLTFGY